MNSKFKKKKLARKPLLLIRASLARKKLVKKPKRVLVKKKLVKKKIAKKKKLKVKKIVAKKKSPVKKKALAKKNKPKKVIKPVVVKKIALKRKTPKVKKVNRESAFLAESFFKAKIKVIGIGGGGGSIVSEIGRSLGKATFVVADTDMRAFKKRSGIKNFLFGQELTHGLGTGVNPELGRMAAEQEKERIAHFFDDQDIVIFIASLGGGLGSGATQVFAQAAENFNGITFGIFTLPFKFEGKNKYAIAQKALRQLRKFLNVSITIPNERIFKIIDENTAITDAFSIVNKSLIESLESLIDLIYNPGIINIDFADLRAILKGKGNLAFLNTAEASGKNRAEEISEKILHNLLYQNNNFTTEKILFNIEGGGNLSMFEVDKISRAISAQSPKAKIIFGISKNSALKNKIKTTLLMTGASVAKEAVIPKPLPTKHVVKEKASLEKSKVTASKSKVKSKKHFPKKIKKEVAIEKIPFSNILEAFNQTPATRESSEASHKKMQPVAPAEGGVGAGQFNRVNVMEVSPKSKKAIRRSGLDIKKAEEQEEGKQSLQEKEWEIPAFLRLKK